MRNETRTWSVLWPGEDGRSLIILDSAALPHEVRTLRLETVAEVAEAIRLGRLRGALASALAAAFGLAFALRARPVDAAIAAARSLLTGAAGGAAPRVVLDRVVRRGAPLAEGERFAAAWDEAHALLGEKAAADAAVGRAGRAVIARLAERRGDGPVRVLAVGDADLVLPALQVSAQAGLPLHVWCTQAEPGFEAMGIASSLIGGAAVGRLMQQGQVDLVLAGADAVAANGDLSATAGTYLTALAAGDNGVPFYVVVHRLLVDATTADGGGLPFDEGDPREVLEVVGRAPDGRVQPVRVASDSARAVSLHGDLTPVRLVSAYLTDVGALLPDEPIGQRLSPAMPERASRT